MYNTKIPAQADLPTSGQLLRSTVIAAVTAAVLLVTTVLPAEYGIDPTGVGRVLGLTEMGEIKATLAEEAEADERAAKEGAAPPTPAPATAAPDQRSEATDAFLSRLAGLVVPSAHAAMVVPASPEVTAAVTTVAEAAKSDEMSLTLSPGQGAEVKVAMKKGAKTSFAWTAEGGVVNFDTHGEPSDAPNKTHSYNKGRGAAKDEGEITAAFDGNHGWFWRNRGSQPVTIKLRASGDYSSFKRVM
ncbi:transmembrane anchor protein [Azospirillum sp. SYSU D00513]|uniref:transmembrane anchor protein n=1 Tax=Azospirillum sp. SYSU D00513 TaxID=2812561 RepID=UPI001A9757FA|nr:transmembrane anchor protein [Azospirillum sp. SYSU D00513]